MNTDLKRIEAIFCAALEKASATERAAFLNEACAGDPVLRERVEALLRPHDEAGRFLEQPIGGPAVPEPGAQTTLTQEFPEQDPPGPAQPASRTKVRYFGDYELLEEIARGGMGVVYKARQVSLNRLVALKMILRGELATEAEVQRFHREAEAAAQLDHPNIVPIYEVGEHEGQHYFSMKLIEGVNLTSFRREPAASTTDQRRAAQLLTTTSRAVHHAHQRGILHRDLKPGNILLDKAGQPHVTDFGLARRVEGQQGMTQSGAILGTPGYMPPEQAVGRKDLSTAVDTYSLGAILYELLTGQPPFGSDNVLETLRQVVEREPRPPRQLNPQVDRDLETICLKCLDKEPGRRYASAEALADDLDCWLRSEPIAARPAGPGERAWRWCRRNPVVSALAGALAASLLAGIVVSAWYGVVAEKRAIHADKEKDRADGETAKAREEKLRADRETGRVRRHAYAATVNLIGQAWENHQIKQVRELLPSLLPERTGGEELRGFEWFYWNRLANSELRIWEAKSRCNVDELSISPDGTRIVVVGGEVRDTMSGKRILDLPQAARPDDPWSPEIGHYIHQFTPDGKWLVLDESPTDPKVDKVDLLLADATTGKTMHRLSGLGRSVYHVSCSADGSRLGACDGRYRYRIWDVKTLKVIQSGGGKEENFYVRDLCLAPDGQTVALYVGGPQVQIWQVQPWQRRLVLPVTPTAMELNSTLRFSPDGKLLAFASKGTRDQQKPNEGKVLTTERSGYTVVVCDAATGQPRYWLEGPARVFRSLAFSPDSKRIAIGSEDGLIRVWDLGREVLHRTLLGHTTSVKTVCFHPDGTQLVSVDIGGTVCFWDFQKDPALRRLRPKGTILALGPRGDRFVRKATNGQDGLEVVDRTTDKVMHVIAHSTIRKAPPDDAGQLPATELETLWSAVLDTRGQRLVTVDQDNRLLVWNLQTGGQPSTLFPGDPSKKHSVLGPPHWWFRHPLFSPDGRYLAALDAPSGPVDSGRPSIAADHCDVKVWDLETMQLVLTVRNHYASGHVRRFTAAGDLWLGFTDEPATRKKSAVIVSQLWSLPEGKLRTETPAPLEGDLLAFHPESGLMVLRRDNELPRVCDWMTGEERLRLTTNGYYCCFDRDGRRLAMLSFGPDGRSGVKILDTVTGLEVFHSYPLLPGQSVRTYEIIFSADDRSLILRRNNEMIVWEAREDIR